MKNPRPCGRGLDLGVWIWAFNHRRSLPQKHACPDLKVLGPTPSAELLAPGLSAAVALSNHADFSGTLEYIRATGARYVVTDNTRGGHAAELAQEVTRQLGIPARPSTVAWSREWGL